MTIKYVTNWEVLEIIQLEAFPVMEGLGATKM